MMVLLKSDRYSTSERDGFRLAGRLGVDGAAVADGPFGPQPEGARVAEEPWIAAWIGVLIARRILSGEQIDS
jgi:hypothetical protein